MVLVMSGSKNRVIVLAIVQGGLSVAEAAERFGVSTRWIRILVSRYRNEGLEGLEPRSRRPQRSPTRTSDEMRARILRLRDSLEADGLDAGPESIRDRLSTDSPRPSAATIWRILKAHGRVVAQPQKRPRSSWKRFEAAAPNETWQSDVTHWRLADRTGSEIISWLDDHSRKLLHISAHVHVTGPTVVDTFTRTSDHYGLPASTLTDNGLIYTTRFAGGGDGSPARPNAFEQLLADLHITQKNGAPNHPMTQGKIERFHQTLKKWLTARPRPATNTPELQTQLDEFRTIYNTQRPHRAIGRRTPDAVYNATLKATPVIELNRSIWRVRHDRVDTAGKITLRYQGRLRHLHIGRAHNNRRVIVLIHNNQTITLGIGTGEILAEHTIDPTKSYQPKH